MKKLLMLALISFSALAKSADFDPDKVVEHTIKLIVSNKANEAFDFAIKSNPSFKEMVDSTTSAKDDFVSLIRRVGVPSACEKLSSRNLNNRYRTDVYLCLSEKQPIELHFEFYRPKNEWRIQSFSYSSEVDKYIEESIAREIGDKSIVKDK